MLVECINETNVSELKKILHVHWQIKRGKMNKMTDPSVLHLMDRSTLRM